MARGHRGADEPGRRGGIAQQQARVRMQLGRQLPDVPKRGRRAVARLADLGVGHRELGSRIRLGECGPGTLSLGEVQGRRGQVAPAERDQAEYPVRGAGMPERSERFGDGQPVLGRGGRLRELAGRQADPRAQDGQRRLGRDAAQPLVVCDPQDLLRLVKLTQVNQGGCEREQRLRLAGVG